MDPESQKRLTAILATDLAAITEADAAFLRARSAYLNEEQKAKFAEVLRGVAVEEAAAEQPADPAPEAPAETPKKKGK